MNATVTNITDKIRVYSDYDVALKELVVAPLADRLGITGEEAEAHFDVEMMFDILTEYESYSGAEGYVASRTTGLEDMDIESFRDF